MNEVIRYAMEKDTSATPAISRKAAEDVMQRAKRLVQTIDRSIWDLGQAISEILDKQLYLYGFPAYSSFDNFADVELGFGGRKAQFYAQIFKTFFAAELGPGEINHLGSTKCRLLARVITIDNKDFWIKKAEELTTRQLENAIMKKGGLADGKLGSIVIPYYNEETRIAWLEAAELASRMTGCESRESVLEALVAEFLATYSDSGTHSQEEQSKQIAEYEILSRANWRCEVAECQKRVSLQVHHVVFRSQDPSLKDEASNKIVLCKTCHDEIHLRQGELIKIGNEWAIKKRIS